MSRRQLSFTTLRDRIAQDLNLVEVQQLHDWLTQHRTALEAEQAATEPGVTSETSSDPDDFDPNTTNMVFQRQRQGKSCFQLEGVKCGKPGCKCASGHLHGPYWYEYFREGKRVRKRYHGKRIKSSLPTSKQSSAKSSTTH